MSLSREEYAKRYPTADYEMYLESESMVNGYYSMPKAELNAQFQAIFQENKKAGYSND